MGSDFSRESFWFIQYIRLGTRAHIAHASLRRGKTQRVPWKEDKIRKSPDGTGTIRIWQYRNLRLYWTKERWSWKEIGTLLKRTNLSSILIYFMTHNSWVTWWNIPNLKWISYWEEILFLTKIRKIFGNVYGLFIVKPDFSFEFFRVEISDFTSMDILCSYSFLKIKIPQRKCSLLLFSVVP